MDAFSFSPLYHLADSLLPGAVIVLLIGVAMGFVSSLFGIGGGFLYTPFFHTALKMSAAQSVATSLGQMPIMSISGIIHYAKARKIRYREGFLLLAGSLPAAQAIAWSLGNISSTAWGKTIVFSSVNRADLIVALFFTIFIGGLGLYNVARSGSVIARPQGTPERRASAPAIFLVGLLFGIASALIGIGGGFVSVPFFVYFCKFEPIEATATSLFAIFITSSITMLHYLYINQLYLSISLLAGAGGLIGGILGSRAGTKASSTLIMRSFGLLQILVVFIYLFSKFFIF